MVQYLTRNKYYFDGLSSGQWKSQLSSTVASRDTQASTRISTSKTCLKINPNLSSKSSDNCNTKKRYFAIIPQFFVPSLSLCPFASLFQQCRFASIQFDFRNVNGILFLLYDSLASGLIGICSVAETVQQSINQCRRTLIFLQQLIDSISLEQSHLLHLVGEKEQATFEQFIQTLEKEERKHLNTIAP